MDNYTLLLPTLFQQRIFLIPDYQRGYAWEKEQVGELLEDLELLNAPRRHYAGTIVLCKTADAPIMGNDGTLYATHAVVDGQQRLTTIVLLLNELSRALAAYPERAASLRMRRSAISRSHAGLLEEKWLGMFSLAGGSFSNAESALSRSHS